MAVSNSRAEGEAHWKPKELDIVGGMELEDKKTMIELNMLMLQEKEQLLITRKRLLDAGVTVEAINSVLSIQN